jgi:hypothetical protein
VCHTILPLIAGDAADEAGRSGTSAADEGHSFEETTMKFEFQNPNGRDLEARAQVQWASAVGRLPGRPPMSEQEIVEVLRSAL